MPTPLYQLRVCQVGKYVAQTLEENSLILFSAPVPQEIADYCVVHQASQLTAPLQPGQTLLINQTRYFITAVGEVATVNLRQLGHITLSFDGQTQAILPGTVHLRGKTPQDIKLNDQIGIYAAVSAENND